MKRSSLREMHEWSLFFFFFVLINSLVCFILFSVVFPTVQSFFLRICIVLWKAAQANCPGFPVLLSPKPGAILCQTVDSHFTVMFQKLAGLSKHSDYTITVHTSYVPQYLNFLLCASLVLESVSVWRAVQLSPTVHKGLCNFVLPSFTYLTAAVLSFVVFPFTLYSSTLTPAEQWIILIFSLNDPLISMPMLTLIGLIAMRLFPLWLEVSR